MNIPRLTAAASIAAPRAKKSAPMARDRVRPKLSDTAPAKSETMVAGIKMLETMIPSSEEESLPKLAVNEGMTMTGPMVEVSRLGYVLDNKEKKQSM